MINYQTETFPKIKSFEQSKNIGLISDTHIPIKAKYIPKIIFDIFKNVDFIIHAGDLIDFIVIDELEHLAPVLSVQGNMDNTLVKKKLPKVSSVKVFDWKIGVIHNPNTSSNSKNLYKISEKEGFDVLVFGHTHNPSIKWEDKKLFINPGSPTNPLPPIITKPSVALIKINENKIEPQIINI